MENKEFNISKPVSAFIALIIAFLVVGYYVVNLLDIETKGTTAEEALLPNVVPDLDDPTVTDNNFNAVRYPAGWIAETISGGYRFTSNDEVDPKPQISIFIDIRGISQILADVGQTDAPEIDNIFDSPESGRSYSIDSLSEDGQVSLTSNVILYPLPDRRTLRGELIAPSDNINDYREKFDLMMQSANPILQEVIELPSRDSVEAPELTQVADDTDTVITMQYPDGWTVNQNISNGIAGILAQQTGDMSADLAVFLLSPNLTIQGVLGLQQVNEVTPEGILNAFTASRDASQIILPTNPVTIGKYEGAHFVLRGISEGTVSEIGVLNYDNGLYLTYILSTSIDNLPEAQAATDAMLQSIEYIEPSAVIGSEIDSESIDGGESLLLTESIYGASTDFTLRYPESWQAQPAPDSPSIILSGLDASTQVQISLINSQEVALQLQLDPSLISTTTALEAILNSIQIQAENIVQEVQSHTVGDYSGDNAILLFPPDPGLLDQPMVEIGLLRLSDDQYLQYLVFGSVDGFADLRATVDEILISLQFGDTTAEDADTDVSDSEDSDGESTDDSTDSDTESDIEDSTTEEDTSDAESDSSEETDSGEESTEADIESE